MIRHPHDKKDDLNAALALSSEGSSTSTNANFVSRSWIRNRGARAAVAGRDVDEMLAAAAEAGLHGWRLIAPKRPCSPTP